MPKDDPSLRKSDMAAISDWIARGVHFDEPEDVTGSTCVLVPPDLAATVD